MAARACTVETPNASRQELRRPARIVLLTGEGMPGERIAARVGRAEPTMLTRQRYAQSGLVGLEDLARPSSESPLSEALRHRVLELTLTEPPTRYRRPTGPRGYWPRTARRSRAPPSPGSVTATTCRRSGQDTFTSSPTRSRSRRARSATSSGRVAPAPGGEGGSALRRREAAAAGADRAGAVGRKGSAQQQRPSTTSGTAPDAVRGAGGGHGVGHRRPNERHRHFLRLVAAAFPPPPHFMATSGSLNVVEASFSIPRPRCYAGGTSPQRPTSPPSSAVSSTPRTATAPRTPGLAPRHRPRRHHAFPAPPDTEDARYAASAASDEHSGMRVPRAPEACCAPTGSYPGSIYPPRGSKCRTTTPCPHTGRGEACTPTRATVRILLA
jgi:hypothetical protein